MRRRYRYRGDRMIDHLLGARIVVALDAKCGWPVGKYRLELADIKQPFPPKAKVRVGGLDCGRARTFLDVQ